MFEHPKETTQRDSIYYFIVYRLYTERKSSERIDKLAEGRSRGLVYRFGSIYIKRQ